MAVLTWGAILQDVRLAGVGHSLTLGSEDLGAYLDPMAYFGAIVGPVANRVSGAGFALDGQRFALEANEGPNTLHSERTGTHAQVWSVAEHSGASLTLALDLPDRLGGFPGNRQIEARYDLEGATLRLSLRATSDAPTVMNLANHSYWNLDGSEDTSEHLLQIETDQWLALDEANLPTGEVEDVAGTRFDLREGRVLEDAFDHNFCLSVQQQALRPVAWLTGAAGVGFEMATTEPGLQVYTADGLSTGVFAGHRGTPYGSRAGVALEAQGWPDAPNRPAFPSVRLEPGQTYAQTTEWRFR